jgi:beta-lactam-binding protein with PASTA domain
MAYKQYGKVLNTLNIKAKNVFNWNQNYNNGYGQINLNHKDAHSYINRKLIRVATNESLLGYVPSVKNIDYNTASLILRNSGFTPDPVYSYTNSTSFQQYNTSGGYVTAQSPAPSASSGTLLQYGSSVRLDVLLYTSAPIDSSTVPNAPLWSNATAADSSVILTFVTPSNGGSAITRYEYSITNGATWIAIGLPANNTFTVSGLTNNVSYTFYIRAVNAKGNSASSSGVSKSPSAGSSGGTITTPAAPTFTVSFITNTSFRINLTAPTNTGGADITRYQHTLDGGTTWTNDFTNTGPITISSLNPGQTYQVAIRAVNSAGSGLAAVTQNVTTTKVVPDVTGIALNTAKTIITSNGYIYGDGTVSASNNQFYLNYSGGYTSAQSPVAGSTLTGGSTIRVDYTTYLAAPSYGTVPNVVGLSYSNAISQIQQAGYSNITQVTQSDATKNYGIVYAQTPSAGTAALVNTVVTITYSDFTGTLQPPTNRTLPSITYDNLYIGSVFTLNPGLWTDSPTSYTYQWYDSNGNNFINATGSTYTANATTVSRYVTAKVVATNAAGSSAVTPVGTSYGPIRSLVKPSDIGYISVNPRAANSISIQWSGGDSPFYFVGIYKAGTSAYVGTKITNQQTTTFTGLDPAQNYFVQIFGNNNSEYTNDSTTSSVLSTFFSAAPSTPVLNSATKSGNVINFSTTRGSNDARIRIQLENLDGSLATGAGYTDYGFDLTQGTVSGSYSINGISSGTYKLAAYGYNEDYGVETTGSKVQISI